LGGESPREFVGENTVEERTMTKKNELEKGKKKEKGNRGKEMKSLGAPRACPGKNC